MMDIKDTKKKILDVSHTLFAEKGYEGTSVRDIATLAEVNIAAINYHFQNKENLYKETIRNCFHETSEMFNQIYQKHSASTVEFADAIFDFFIANSSTLLTGFKMHLSNSEHYPTEIDEEDDLFGPPGAKVLAECILKELGNKIKEEDLYWAVRVIFTQILHSAVIICTNCSKREKLKFAPTTEHMKKSNERLIKVVLSEIS
jgi:AcrR family transcriptional regulator